MFGEKFKPAERVNENELGVPAGGSPERGKLFSSSLPV